MIQADPAPDTDDGDIALTKLESYLKALAFAPRLALLALLRKPRTLDEIRLTPRLAQAGLNPERAITRQGVQNHLDQLVEAGLVSVGVTSRKGRPMNEYSLNRSRLFAIVEELRSVSALRSAESFNPFLTEDLPEVDELRWEEGAKVVIVHGAREGLAFPLRLTDLEEGPRGWVIGRAADADVSLSYDPFVSAENAEVLRAPAGFRLLDLRTARNGTYLNWKRLPIGGEAALRHGDIIGVGRTLLLFRED